MVRDSSSFTPDPAPKKAEPLSEAELRRLDLLTCLKSPPDVRPHLASIRLCSYAAGDRILNTQSNRGVVFYLPTWQELLRLKRFQLQAAEAIYEQLLTRPADQRDAESSGHLQQWIEELTEDVAELERCGWGCDDSDSAEKRTASAAPLPIDFFPGDVIDPARLLEYSAAPPLSVVAERDCCLLQLPRTLYRSIAADAGFRRLRDNAYRAAGLESQLRRLPCFADLEPEAMGMLLQYAELVTADAGALLGDENAEAETAYLIRNGVVDVRRNQSALVSWQASVDWTSLCRLLLSDDEASP